MLPLNHRQINTAAVTDDGGSATAPPRPPPPWSFETNWTVSRGSLNTSVTLESPDFPIDSESIAPKPPLLLVPPSSSEYEPCEIKINFIQKHEIRQVYVRSTSRVYEIYYAPALDSENEYLCTVHCSLASVEENLFLGTDVKETGSANLESPDGILPRGNVAGENNIGTSENDWVEVKLPPGRLDEGNSLPNQTSSNVRNYQDYYEATAEINDSDTCMSLTLRLLSLQRKNRVYIDEVYIFADPIDPISENQTANAQPSSGSTLMTMLVPTLLGLAKSRATQLPDQGSKSTEKPECLKTESQPAIFSNLVDEKLLKSSEFCEANAPAPDKERDSIDRATSSCSQVERVLEELVSRVSRIEDICLRFEENMVKPINSMEARLQRVEQQVESLAENSRSPRPTSCPRVESDTHDSELCGASETETTVSGSNETHEPPQETSVVVSTRFRPGLVVTAPEFSCSDEGDEEEVNDVLVAVKNPSEEKPKKTVSIDDALAAALAGFSSFTISGHPKDYDGLTTVPFESSQEERLRSNDADTDTSPESNTNDDAYNFSDSQNVNAPEFTGKENDVSHSNKNERFVDTKASIATGVWECTRDLTSTFSDEEAIGLTGDSSRAPAHEIDPCRSGAKLVEKMSGFDKSDILKRFPSNASDTAWAADGSEPTFDFQTPILEVEFVSSEIRGLMSPLEALLSNTDDLDMEGTKDRVVITWEEGATAGNNLLVELDDDDDGVGGLVVGEVAPQDTPPVCRETFASLI